MKEFRKNKQGLFICEECQKTYIRKADLSYHISYIHNNLKNYYDKWLKDNDEGLCKIYRKETLFTGLKCGYKHCCCKECSNKYKYEQLKKSNLKNYNVENTFQRKDSKLHQKQTKKERYGDENYTNPEKNKQTCVERYGVENQFQREDVKEKNKETMLKNHGVEYAMQSKEIQEKSKQTRNKKYKNGWFDVEISKQTNLKNIGVEWPMQSKEIQEKTKKTNLERYGVEHPSQNIEVLNKGFKTRFTIHHYKDTNLTYQGSYELDFIEKHYDKYPDIQNGPSIKYRFDNKDKVYHSDFFIPILNLVVEIKNSYLAEKDRYEIEAKKKATIVSGFKYIMIVDKDYTDFNKI